MEKLKVTPDQKLSSMSCGQRSQVALGLILAQNADLLVLDDFLWGLMGYRRLFTDYLREYAKAENKTVFMTSHIIQDMERLVDDCIILDYGRILVQKPVKELMDTFHRYAFTAADCSALSPTAASTALRAFGRIARRSVSRPERLCGKYWRKKQSSIRIYDRKNCRWRTFS